MTPELTYSDVQLAILAKAPVAGLAKTRLIPALGAAGAARLQRQFTLATLRTARAAGLGGVTLWCTPSPQHRFFHALTQRAGVRCMAQAPGDLGARMYAAFCLHCAAGPTLLIGTDCPALQPSHLRAAAGALRGAADGVCIPAEDGGYVLIGLKQPQPALFEHMPWSSAEVMAQTRARSFHQGLRLHEMDALWDVDEPADLQRLRSLSPRWQRELRP